MRYAVQAMLILLIGQPTLAQEKEKSAEDILRDKLLVQVMDDFADSAQAHLLVQVDEMKEVCKLNEAAVRKLRIAAKGAASRYCKAFEARIKNGIARNVRIPKGIEVRVNGRVIAQPQKKRIVDFFRKSSFVDVRAELKTYGVQLSVRRSNSSSSQGFGGGGLRKLLEQPIWKKSVDRLITADKKKVLEKLRNERTARLTRSAVMFQVAQIDAELRLTESQRKQLSDMISAVFKSTNYDRNTIQWRLTRQLKKIDKKQLAKILTKPQMRIWTAIATN